MLKRMKQNKKMLIAVLVIIALTLISGVTYAWFTSSVSIKNPIEMGTLKISASLQDDPGMDGYGYQPGEDLIRTGIVKNVGTLDSFVMVEQGENGRFIIKSDEDGNPITWYEISGDAAAEYYSVDFADDEKGYKVNNDGSMYAWAQIGTTEDYVLLLSGAVEAPVEYQITFDGEKMDNKFQNAVMHLDTKWNATQILDGATRTLFGFEWDDLNFIDVDLEDSQGFAPFSTRSRLSAAQRRTIFLEKLQELEDKNSH